MCLTVGWMCGLACMYLLNSPAMGDTKSIFKQSTAGLNSLFFISQTDCLTKAKEPSLPNYLPIDGRETRLNGFIPFSRALA